MWLNSMAHAEKLAPTLPSRPHQEQVLAEMGIQQSPPLH
jgi:hypothetical protein